jgi:chemotaxis protein MotB
MAIEEDPPAGVPEWVVTFGDMMSLLLTFFIMLVSMSEMKQENKFHAIVESLRKKFGHDLSNVSLAPGQVKVRGSRSAAYDTAMMGRSKRLSTETGGDKVQAPVGDHARVASPREATTTRTGGIVPFSGEQVELDETQIQALDTIAEALRGKTHRVEVRGHTNRRPPAPGSPFRDNWDLAYARTRKVAERLIAEGGIDPRRIRIAVAGDTEPQRVQGVSDARVDVFLLDETTLELEPAPTAEIPSEAR